MSVRYLYNTSGQYVGFVQGTNVFLPDAEWLGFIRGANEVYSALNGSFIGYISDDDRVYRITREPAKPLLLKPFKPFKPFTPFRPFPRLRMPKLPYGYQDVFETDEWAAQGRAGGTSAAIATGHADLSQLEGSSLFAGNGQYLGLVTRNPYSQDSLTNPYSHYGNRYSETSIFNQFCPYGGSYGEFSPFNPYSHKPPVFVRDGVQLNSLTVNPYIQPSIQPNNFLAWLGHEG